MKRFSLILIGLLSVLWMTHAQDSTWSVWLYDPDSGDMLRIDEDGTVRGNAHITLPDGYGRYPGDIAVSHGGGLAAYVVTNDAQERLLVVYDLTNGRITTTYALPMPHIGALNAYDQLALTPTTLVYNGDDTALAFSTWLGGEGWQIIVLDVRGDVLMTLSHTDPALRSHPAIHGGQLPIVQQHREGRVTFTVQRENAQMFVHNYTWDTTTNIIRADVAYSSIYADTLHPGGEVVTSLPDYEFPALEDGIARNEWAYNTLAIYNPLTFTRFPFYSTETYSLSDVFFAQGGERVLVRGINGEGRISWLVIGRDGVVEHTLPNADRRDITMTPDGFTFLTTHRDSLVLVETSTRDFDAGRTVWVDERLTWRVVWTSAVSSGSDVLWARLHDGVTAPFTVPYEVLMEATMTPLPDFLPMLYPGLEAQVQMTDDEYLNLRDAPSINSNVLAFLESGAYIDLLQGPVEAEGFVWWRVRVGRREGWLVERIDSLQTVIPRLPPQEEVTETPEP